MIVPETELCDPEIALLLDGLDYLQFVVELTADSKKKTVEGVLLDPRLFGVSCMAAPTGVEPVFRP